MNEDQVFLDQLLDPVEGDMDPDILTGIPHPPGSPIDINPYILAMMAPPELHDLFPELQMHSAAPTEEEEARAAREFLQSRSDEYLEVLFQAKQASAMPVLYKEDFWRERLERYHPAIYASLKDENVDSWRLLYSYTTLLGTNEEGYYVVTMNNLEELWESPLILKFVLSHDVGLTEPFLRCLWDYKNRRLTTKMLEYGFRPNDNVEAFVDCCWLGRRFDLVEKMAKYGFYPDPDLLSRSYQVPGMASIFQILLVVGTEPRSNNDITAFWLGQGRQLIINNICLIALFDHTTPVELPQFLYDAFQRCEDTAIISNVRIR